MEKERARAQTWQMVINWSVGRSTPRVNGIFHCIIFFNSSVGVKFFKIKFGGKTKKLLFKFLKFIFQNKFLKKLE